MCVASVRRRKPMDVALRRMDVALRRKTLKKVEEKEHHNMNAEDMLYHKIEERDRLEFSLCDSTDVKASILLLLITFLATLSASLVAEKDLNALGRSGQAVVIVFLAISTVFSVSCLRPRDYS